jgi:hypothetical protein
MHDPIAAAAVSATVHSAPPKTWEVGPDADLGFGSGHPFEGLQLTHWTRD